MSAIGIIGGMGPQASAHLLDLLVRDAPQHMSIASDSDFPEIMLLSVPVPNFVTNKTHLQQAKQILKKRLKLLEQSGCVVAGIACNTAHLMLPELQQATTVPFIAIPELVAAEIARNSWRRVGLTGSPNTLASTLFDDAIPNHTALIRPDIATTTILERLIFKELSGMRTEQDRRLLHTIINRFMHTQELDAVILGCTELPLIFGDSDDAHIIDTLSILSKGLLQAYLERHKTTNRYATSKRFGVHNNANISV
jgi:aspartate racemase